MVWMIERLVGPRRLLLVEEEEEEEEEIEEEVAAVTMAGNWDFNQGKGISVTAVEEVVRRRQQEHKTRKKQRLIDFIIMAINSL